jgi:hypothetical protein
VTGGHILLDIVAKMFFICSEMNTHSSIAAEEALEADAPFDPDGERAEQLLRVLARLTELGMVLAERLVAQVTAPETTEGAAPIDAGEVGTAFAKISRGVRMTVMLEAKLAKERRLRRDGLEAAHEARLQAKREARWAKARAEAEAEEDERNERRQNAIDDAVKDVIRAERPEGLERERLFERVERFWKVDFETDPYVPHSLYLDTGGSDALVSKQIAAFCKVLGLKPDWDLWKDSFWAIEETEDEAAGSPYAAKTGPP